MSKEILSTNGEKLGEITLNENVFGVEPNLHVMHLALRRQLNNARQGSACAKTRAEVSGGGKKPWKQKGTGRARQGSIRATQFRGGGTVFGATPRNYAYRINKKVRRLAVKSALSEKVQETAFSVLDKFEIAEPKTKTFVSIIEAIQAPKKTLFVVADSEDATNVYLSARNIAGATVMSASAINTYDLVNANKVVMTSAAVKQVEEALA